MLKVLGSIPGEASFLFSSLFFFPLLLFFFSSLSFSPPFFFSSSMFQHYPSVDRGPISMYQEKYVCLNAVTYTCVLFLTYRCPLFSIVCLLKMEMVESGNKDLNWIIPWKVSLVRIPYRSSSCHTLIMIQVCNTILYLMLVHSLSSLAL